MNAPPVPSVLPEGGFLSQPWEGRTARFASRRLRSSVAVVRADGGIASNADAMTEYTLNHLKRCRGLILDLRGLDFFGTEGFTALHRVSVCCARDGIGWVLVPGGAVSRLLRICDPQATLPVASTLEAAMATVQGRFYRSPQPTDSRRELRTIREMRTRGVLSQRRYTHQVRHEQRTWTESTEQGSATICFEVWVINHAIGALIGQG